LEVHEKLISYNWEDIWHCWWRNCLLFVPCWQACHTELYPELVESSPHPTISHPLLYLLSVCT